MKNYLSIMARREAYKSGIWSKSDMAEYAADVAFDSGLTGEDELTLTALVYTLITDETYNPDDWA